MFFLQHLVAMERVLVELMTINMKVHNWAHVKSDMIERGDPLWVPSFHRTSDVSTFKIFWGLLQLDRPQQTVVCCNRREVWTPHLTRPFFTVNYMHTHGSSFGSALTHPISCFMWALCLIAFSSTTPFTSPSPPSSLLTPCPSFCPSTSSSRMWWTNSLCTSAEDLGTLAEYEPPTGYEPKREPHHGGLWTLHPGILGGAAVPNDFDDDDVTIGKAFSDACRRRADHSQEEGLPSCLSSSVSQDGTGRPLVAPFDSQVSSVQEIQRHSSESEQIRILLDRQREQILADCQAEIRKHEFQADYDRRSVQKLNQTIGSQKKKNFVVITMEMNDFDKIDNFFMNSYWNKIWIFVKLMRKASVKWKNWRRFQGSTFDTIARRKLVEDRDTILELSGKRQELQNEWMIHLYERFERFSRSWIRTQWTFSRYQSTCVTPTFSRSWRNAKQFSGNAEPQKWAAKHLGHTWKIGKRCCQSNSVFFSTFSAGIESMEF